MEIEGTVSVVTGGASGLAEATIRALVEAGGRVAILDLNREKGEALARELGDVAAFFPLDVSQNAEVESAIEAVKKTFGTFHIVINCAGIGGSVKIVGKEGIVPVEWFTNIVNVNLVGTFQMIRATVPTLMENSPNAEGERGVYINTGSIAAYDGQVGQAAYSASKGGIVSMTLTLAREFANNGIRIMTILPGIFDTPLLANNTPEVLERLSKQVPFPARLGKATEYASLACHIVQNPYLNGEIIRLDGALRMGFGRK
jgi:NAD(P)-dependent dehydrogenase (short-subunit alcohol dehydrogenase family)